MKDFNFGEVLTRAWQIIWKHKVLWIFGILASCGQGRGGGNSSSNFRNNGNPGNFGSNLPPQFLQFANWLENHVMQFVIIIFAVVCIIWIIALFLSTIGRIGLIRGAAQADGGAESLLFGQLFSESIPYFWRMFGLSLIIAIPVLLFVVVLVVGMLLIIIPASQNNASSALSAAALIPVLIGCCCLFIPVMFVLGMIFSQAERALVLEELGVMPALSRGWEVFRANLGPMILMAIILAVLGFVSGLIIAIPIFIIVFPTMFAYLAGGAQSASPLIFMGVCICLYFPVALVLQGIVTSYTETAWTLTFMRLTGTPTVVAQPPLDNIPAPAIPASEPDDNNQTVVAAPPAEDNNKTIISKRPDA